MRWEGIFKGTDARLQIKRNLYLRRMPGNSFGTYFRITTFGESHGPAIGVVIDGCPPGIALTEAQIDEALARRRPGQSRITTQRKEPDTCEFLSGVMEGKSTGTPLAILIRNSDQRSKDYDHLADTYRPSHADFTYQEKYGIRDHRGGGRSSARETAARVAAGAVAMAVLKTEGIHVQAYVSAVGDIVLDASYQDLDLSRTDENIIRCPDQETAERMISLVNAVRKEGDTIGGVITCVASGVPSGLGEPVFDKLHADLGKAMLSINAAKGFEIGSGFHGAGMRGSTHNDIFENRDGKIVTRTNHSGGIQGGISNGMDIYFRTAFKPVATILRPQETVNSAGQKVSVEGKGRHDPCVLPRAVPIVEAMTAMVLADHLLLQRINRK
ncbi:MAG TPA: chorismate synthase [Chitinophagales bacterium]|nr:chorismate synthase [Chitinophagales bacterium]HQU75279.1 chorismate synthase [Chitinophagales bacterium]